MTNEKAIELMRQRAASSNDRIVFDPSVHEARIGSDGRFHVYMRNGTTTLDHSAGVDDPRPSKLRNALAELNAKNEAFWKERNEE
jgi:hypothetical protein